MSNNGDKVLAQALELPPIERAELIEKLLSSFEFPSRKSIDEQMQALGVDLEEMLAMVE